MTTATFDPFSQAAHDDPYAMYAELRAAGGPVYDEARQMWALSRYADIQAALRDWSSFSSTGGEDIDDTVHLVRPGNLLEHDPPEHRILRGSVQGRFNPKTIRTAIGPFVEGQVEEMVAQMLEEDTVDAAEVLGWALPVGVVMELLGLPLADREFLVDRQKAFIERVPGDPAPPEEARIAATALDRYFADVIEGRRRAPREDLLSFLAAAEFTGTAEVDHAVGMAHVIFAAAVDTTACFLMNTMYLLGSHPDQRDWALDHMDELDQVLEESLRFESPVQNAKRTTTEEIVVGEARIPEGEAVALLFGSANRDEARYAAADRFDVRREPLRNLAFGDGIHHCLGAPLARLEGRIVIEAILQAMPDYAVVEEPERFHSHVIRGLSRLLIAPRG
ncbi:MAG: cytochrome P450 [Actinobacteria bacterium]|nr:cytochrome P450 [Actinomycetota bacterium]